jgi:acetyl esterase/lipase
MPAVDLDDAWCSSIAAGHGCVVASVEWRRAPEHPFPAAIEDCYAGLSWLTENAAELGVDPMTIAVAGESSGGGAAAGLALLVRDRAEFEIAHQMLIYPMLDDSNSTPSSHAVTDPQLWNRTNNEIAWRAYLGPAYGTEGVSPYAAPARMADLSRVAPATMLTNELDLFVDEDITYAQRLIQAGVSTELHVYPGAPHGFHRLAPLAATSRRFIADRDAVLRRVFGHRSDPRVSS